MKKAGCCSKFGSIIADEFQWKNVSFTHCPVDDFYKSQWQRGARSFWWLLYRWCVAGFYISAVVSTAVEHFREGTFFIYLTQWGQILCTLTTTYGAVLATVWYFSYAKKVDPVQQSKIVKFFWGLHWTTLALSVLITVMYWSFLYPAWDKSY